MTDARQLDRLETFCLPAESPCMSSVHRILTGLEFVADLKFGRLQWPAETEDLVRLSLELARATNSDLAFAALCCLGPPVSWKAT